MDVAFVLNRSNPSTIQKSTKKKRIVLFLHRTDLSNKPELIEALQRHHDIVQIKDWLLNEGDISEVFARNIDAILQADVVVSDTYHFLINALREGRPTIGLGVRQTRQTTTVSDFKKKILFEDLGIPNAYIEFAEPVFTKMDEERIVSQINNPTPDCIEFAEGGLDARINTFRTAILKSLC